MSSIWIWIFTPNGIKIPQFSIFVHSVLTENHDLGAKIQTLQQTWHSKILKIHCFLTEKFKFTILDFVTPWIPSTNRVTKSRMYPSFWQENSNYLGKHDNCPKWWCFRIPDWFIVQVFRILKLLKLFWNNLWCCLIFNGKKQKSCLKVCLYFMIHFKLIRGGKKIFKRSAQDWLVPFPLVCLIPLVVPLVPLATLW